MKKLTVYFYCLVESLLYMAAALLVGWFATIAHEYFAGVAIAFTLGFCVIVSFLNYAIRTDGFAFFTKEDDDE